MQANIFDPFSTKDRITYQFGDGTIPRIIVDETDLDLSLVTGVWMRQKPLVIHPSWSPLEQAAANFRQSEWRVGLRHLSRVLQHAIWMNPIEEQTFITIKPNQLNLAQECGLKIPETRVTNDYDVVLDMFARYKKVIYKSLSWVAFPDQTGVMTNLISKDYVEENRESILKCPGIFQRFIEKEFELRITVVGNELFAAKINSPKEGRASIDWRRAHFDDIFEPFQLDSILESKIRAFQNKAGLVFGAYDLIVSTDGSTYFLECNPSGQYLWLKDTCNIDISPSVASFFARNGNTK